MTAQAQSTEGPVRQAPGVTVPGFWDPKRRQDRPELPPTMVVRFLTETNWSRVEALEAFARARGRSLLELAFGWLAAQPVVPSVIAGATSPAQVAMNVEAVGWKLAADELAEIDRIAPLELHSDGTARS